MIRLSQIKACFSLQPSAWAFTAAACFVSHVYMFVIVQGCVSVHKHGGSCIVPGKVLGHVIAYLTPVKLLLMYINSTFIFLVFLPPLLPLPSSPFSYPKLLAPAMATCQEKLFMIDNQYSHRDKHTLWETQADRERGRGEEKSNPELLEKTDKCIATVSYRERERETRNTHTHTHTCRPK